MRKYIDADVRKIVRIICRHCGAMNEEAQMTRLKPCPFCGINGKSINCGENYLGQWSVRCECGAVMWDYSKERVIEAWNKRANE